METLRKKFIEEAKGEEKKPVLWNTQLSGRYSSCTLAIFSLLHLAP